MQGLLYQLLIHSALPIVTAISWRKCTQAKSENAQLPDCFAEKFGRIKPKHSGGIVIHAVSLGETRSITPLLNRLQNDYPELPITLTNGSVRGAKQLAGTLPSNLEHHFLPLDYPFAINAFLDRTKPKVLVIVETEIWPNLIAACKKRQIPIVLINARLKESSMQNYRKYGGTWLQQRLQSFTWIGCQFDADKEHFKQLGLQDSQLKLHGNLKFDLAIDDKLVSKTQAWQEQFAPNLTQRFVWVAASTHEGEEALMLEAHRKLLVTIPTALLILVPRQADRFTDVATLLDKQTQNYITRSSHKPISTETEVFLADSVGEMMQWFEIANVAFIGGSLVPFGGHNILEPAAVKTAVISGKWHHNLQALYDAVKEENGVVIVDDTEQLADQLIEFAMQPEKCEQQAELGYQAFKKHSGALERLMNDLKPLLS